MTALAPHISAFLLERLPVERRASPHTQDSYSYAFQLLFQFMSIPKSGLNCSLMEICVISYLERKSLVSFLEIT